MHVRLLLPAVTLWCVRAPAAEADAKLPPPPEARPPILAPTPASAAKAAPAPRPRPAPGSAPSRRALSPEMAKKLSESIERTFPAAKFDGAKAAPDQSGTDGASDATQLEPVIVKEDKLPKLKERDVLKMSAAEKEQQRWRELAELSSVLQAAGAKAPPGVLRKIDEAMTRDNSWLNSPPGTPFREPK